MTTESLDRAELIAIFGCSELVQTLPGRLELRGGTPQDRSEAREWISLFMPEAVLKDRCELSESQQ